MALVITEKTESRQITYGGFGSQGSSARLVFTVHSDNPAVDTEVDVLNAVMQLAPMILLGMVRGAVSIKPLGPGLWEAEVPYSVAQAGRQTQEVNPPEPNVVPPETEKYFVRRRISISEQTQKVYVGYTRGIVTKPTVFPPHDGWYPVPPNVNPYGGLLAVSGDQAEGAEVIIPQLNMSETWRFRYEAINPLYIKKVADIAGKINQEPFRGFEAGELLFLGADFDRISAEEWEATYNFAISPNRYNYVPAPGFGAIPIKYGWDYIWYEYEGDFDGDQNIPIRRPARAFVEMVYHMVDFAELEIGTDW